MAMSTPAAVESPPGPSRKATPANSLGRQSQEPKAKHSPSRKATPANSLGRQSQEPKPSTAPVAKRRQPIAWDASPRT
jgi:hypothetical protein